MSRPRARIQGPCRPRRSTKRKPSRPKPAIQDDNSKGRLWAAFFYGLAIAADYRFCILPVKAGEDGMFRTITIGIALASFALVTSIGSAQAQTDLVKRGDYLVNTIMTCGNCHTPKGPPAAIVGKDFSGGLSWDEPPFKVTAPNITQDKETGIGSWSDADIKKLMRTGVRPNGVQIAMIMPTDFYEIITDRDMDAIVAYLRTLNPVTNTVPAPIYKMPQVHHAFPGAETPYTEAMLSDQVKKGFYLATIGHCMECHTPVSYTHLRAHETDSYLVCRLLL